MSIFRRRKKKEEEKVEEEPKEVVPTLPQLAEMFLDQERGEVDLAWFAEQEGLPFELPLNKFKGFVETRGGVHPVEDMSKQLTLAFKSRLGRTTGPSYR